MASERGLRLFIPIALLEAIDSLHRTRNRLLEELNREPNCDEIVQGTGLDASTVTLLLQTRKVLATLTPREEQILCMRFGIGQRVCTREEVAEHFRVTVDGIREDEAKMLRKLRQTGRSRNLEGFREK
jgi:DNA-directed RNA polymerase sigma subunit (sigma70/sigma32)